MCIRDSAYPSWTEWPQDPNHWREDEWYGYPWTSYYSSYDAYAAESFEEDETDATFSDIDEPTMEEARDIFQCNAAEACLGHEMDEEWSAYLVQSETASYDCYLNYRRKGVGRKKFPSKGRGKKGKKGRFRRRHNFSYSAVDDSHAYLARRKVKGKGKKPGLSLDQRKAALARLKSKTKCRACGKLGHWEGDIICPKGSGKGGKSPTDAKGKSSANQATVLPDDGWETQQTLAICDWSWHADGPPPGATANVAISTEQELSLIHI